MADLVMAAAEWFHGKWDIPLEEYRRSIGACISNKTTIPQWYVVVHQGKIIAGAGVIENDFHCRKDLSPNLCTLYVEERWRHRGLRDNCLTISFWI